MKKTKYCCPKMEKYNKTSKNQELHDFLLETLAWIDYRRR